MYRSGYVIGRYIFLESKIAKNKNLYYDVLEQCQKGWHENTEDSTSFIKYLLQTILELLVSYVAQYGFGWILWSYDDWPLNFQGRISLISS